jgi:hypothetical protein
LLRASWDVWCNCQMLPSDSSRYEKSRSVHLTSRSTDYRCASARESESRPREPVKAKLAAGAVAAVGQVLRRARRVHALGGRSCQSARRVKLSVAADH